MARSKLNPVFEELHGASSPGHIHRIKRFRAANGRIIGYGVQESYTITRPRDFRKKPAKGEEKENQQFFSQAIKIAEKALNNPKLYEFWQKRFEAQIPSTRGSRPDTFALYDTRTGTKKRYRRFDAFVRTMIMQELKAKAGKIPMPKIQ